MTAVTVAGRALRVPIVAVAVASPVEVVEGMEAAVSGERNKAHCLGSKRDC